MSQYYMNARNDAVPVAVDRARNARHARAAAAVWERLRLLRPTDDGQRDHRQRMSKLAHLLTYLLPRQHELRPKGLHANLHSRAYLLQRYMSAQ